MKSRRLRTLIAITVIVVGAGALVANRVRLLSRVHEEETATMIPATLPTSPKLYCEFYNLTHNAVVVSFYFSVDRTDTSHPRFSQMYVVESDGTKTDTRGGDGQEPTDWSFGSDDGTVTIDSPGAAIKIVLYGLRPKASGTFWIEAGLRSERYRNLEGKCRQSGFDHMPPR